VQAQKKEEPHQMSGHFRIGNCLIEGGREDRRNSGTLEARCFCSQLKRAEGEPRYNNITRQKTGDLRERIPFSCHGAVLSPSNSDLIKLN